MWTWKVDESGSLLDGVKIIVLPCQCNEPATEGVIEKASSAVSGFTSSLKATFIEVPTSANPPSEVEPLSWIEQVGGTRSTTVAL